MDHGSDLIRISNCVSAVNRTPDLTLTSDQAFETDGRSYLHSCANDVVSLAELCPGGIDQTLRHHVNLLTDTRQLV